MPKVSVLMTVFNGMPFLKPAVESILVQTMSDFQFIIVNDGSTDDTRRYLESLDDQRIQIIHQENGGTAAAANRGLSQVETKFVARMDADDIALPNRLERQVAFMESHPDVGLVGAQIIPLGENSEGKSLNLPTDHETIFSHLMHAKHGLAHNVIMMRTEILKSIGGYWNRRLIDDWDMMIRMGEVSKLANIDEVLLKYRIHGGSLNGTNQMRIHQHYQYSIHLAKLRQAGRPEISYSKFEEMMNQRPWFHRVGESLHVHAIAQYRIGLSEIYGGRPAIGYLRIGWAAICSPGRTLHRVARIFSGAFHRKRPNHANSLD